MRHLAIALLFFATTAVAQMKESITISYVEVPVTVVDRSGNPIRGLTKENFEIVDEGKKRTITGFDLVDYHEKQAATAAAPAAAIVPAARRNFLLVFDLSFSSPTSIVRAKDAARRFVKEMAASEDRIGVATLDVAHGFRLLTSFTTDRAAVEEAIANPAGFSAVDPLQLAGSSFDPEAVEQMNAPMQHGSGTSTGVMADQHAQIGASLADAADHTDMVTGQNTQQDAYNRSNVERQVNLLAGLSKIMRAVSGQKHLVLLSEGFDSRLVQGRDAGVSQEQQNEAAAVEKGELWNVSTDDRYGSTSSMAFVQKMADVAKRCDVILDAIDIGGLRTQVDARNGFAKKSNEGLHLLSNSTGGTVFQNSNDLGSDFQRALKTEEVVYVLSFQVPVSIPGTFHNLKVRLVNVPGGRAIARTGYYEKGGESDIEQKLANSEILINDIEQEGIHVASLVAPFATPAAKAQVPVILELRGSDLAVPGTDSATLEIFTYAFDANGAVRDSMFQRVGLDLSKIGPTLHQTGIKYYTTLSLPPGKYVVKTLVQLFGTERKGFVRDELVVPEKNDLAVSRPLFIDDGPKWVMIRGGSHDKSGASYPFQANGEAFIPSAAIHVSGGTARRFVVFVQNAVPDELTFETEPQAKVVSTAARDGGVSALLELPASAQPPSSLRVNVRKKGNSAVHTASASLLP